MAPAQGADFAYITNQISNTVSVIDTATQTVVATVPVGESPDGVAVNLAGTRAYVANQDSDTVSVIDTATLAVIATVPVGEGPAALGQFVAPAQPPPNLTLSLTGCLACRAGDRLTVQVRVLNPGTTGTPAEVKIGVRLPSGAPANLLGKHLEVLLPAGMDTSVTVFDIILPAGLPPGTYTFEGALLEPELGVTLSRSARFFEVVP
jgi:YVTN family beta-propeller protein